MKDKTTVKNIRGKVQNIVNNEFEHDKKVILIQRLIDYFSLNGFSLDKRKKLNNFESKFKIDDRTITIPFSIFKNDCQLADTVNHMSDSEVDCYLKIVLTQCFEIDCSNRKIHIDKRT